MKEHYKKESPFVSLLGMGGGGTGLSLGGGSDGPTYVDDVFSTFAYKGTSSARSIDNGIDLATEGGMVWFKNRVDGGDKPMINDTVRGLYKGLYTSETDGEVTTVSGANYGLSSYNSNGFSLNSGSWVGENESTEDIVAWTFRKAPGFLDIVTYNGTGSAQNIPHNLGSVPGMILIKCTSHSSDWSVYHRSLSATKNCHLNNNSVPDTQTGVFNDTEPTSTHFTVNYDGDVNGLDNGVAKTYVAYLFAHDEQTFGTDGDEAIIKCGSITTDGSGFDLENLGFEPQFLITKQTSGGGGEWYMYDDIREFGAQGSNSGKILYANIPNSETSHPYWHPTSEGFEADANNLGAHTFIYMAIRRPNKPAAAATDVFAIDNQGTGTMPPQYHSGFPVDWAFTVAFAETQTYRYREGFTRLLGRNRLKLNEPEVEASYSSAGMDYMDGWHDNNSSVSTTYSWMFKRAPGFFDVVAYEGTGSARTLNHNLGAVPELVIVKNRENASYSWAVYTQTLGRNKVLALNNDEAASTFNAPSFWGSSDFTATEISLGSYANTNHSGIGMVAYLFASLDGISKVGTYSGNSGYDVNVDCGFTAGARFVLIKRTDGSNGQSVGDWYVWDSTRGIVSGNDPYFLLNTDDTDVTGTDYLDPLNAGFTVTSSAPAALNASGGTYMFLAIA